MKVVDLTESLLRSLKVRELEIRDLGDNFIKEQGLDFLESEYKKAVLSDEGEVFFTFGGKNMGKGVWTWLLASDRMKEIPVTSMKLILQGLNEGRELNQALGSKYFYTFNNPAFPREINFLKRLGFKERSSYLFNDGVKRLLLIKEF